MRLFGQTDGHRSTRLPGREQSSVPTPKHFLEIPQRALLSVQTAAALRTALHQGVWPKDIPSERRLCDMFHVSRPTVRAALNILAKEGLIALHHRQRIRVAATRQVRRSARSRKIIIVTHQLYSQWPSSTYQSMSELQAYLGKHGIECELFVCRPQGIPAQLPKIAEFIRQNHVLCGLLVTVRREVQQWFATLPIPSLVVGTCHASVSLPSFDVDYRSVCRHAAGVFLNKGHRRLALVVPASRGPGDQASVDGFLDAVLESAQPAAATVTVIDHDGTAQHLNSRLDTLFRTKAPPTAVLVASPRYFLMVLLYLLRRGTAVPAQVSLISRDQDPMLADLVPAVSHYAFDVTNSTRRLARLILKLIGQKYLPSEPNLIFPRFIAGGTVKAVPA